MLSYSKKLIAEQIVLREVGNNLILVPNYSDHLHQDCRSFETAHNLKTEAMKIFIIPHF